MTRCAEPVTLAGNVITEGLAWHFEETFNGGRMPSLFASIVATPWPQLYDQMSLYLHEFDFHPTTGFSDRIRTLFQNMQVIGLAAIWNRAT